MMKLTQPKKITERIKNKAIELLHAYPGGLRYTELRNKIKESDVPFSSQTINYTIWNLDEAYPDEVYKPSKGLFRLVAFRDRPTASPATVHKIEDEAFYGPFADWLKHEIEDITAVISLGNCLFKDKWGTPKVIGKKEAQRGSLISGTIEIVAAEICADPNRLVEAFGQACVFKLFSHKTYLVICKQAQGDDISRIDSLCHIFGIGLVTFNATDPSEPEFNIMVRPTRHEPDLFYTNRYMAMIEKELFPPCAPE